MTNETEAGIRITSKSITAIVGIFALSASIYGGVSKINSWDYRLERLEYEWSAQKGNVETLTREIKELNAQIVSLTIALNRLQFQQDNLKTEKR